MFTFSFFILILLTFFIHCIDTSSYALRIAGVRTGKVAISAALFNFIFLFSRTATSVQIPLLMKWVESEIISGGTVDVAGRMHVLIGIATLGTIAGAGLIAPLQRVLHAVVDRIAATRSIFRTLLFFLTVEGRKLISLRPAKKRTVVWSITPLMANIPLRSIGANITATAFLTISGFSAIMAATYSPELRGTAVSLFSMLNGISAVISILFVIPAIAIFVDESRGEAAENDLFIHFIGWLVVSRLIGTLFAHILLIPTARLAEWISHTI